ncbi:recombinase family protein [uncultured Vagococcus sp.]|uniref:recombinase family protein n=1 Tax=uncultured Vagococcus sp. TaxID=189676 RepID=UPI0028D18017|nr:recombinase family protein [uncultured Vagococcus sp.]
MAIIGYARVSTSHQKFDSQIEALKKYGVDKIYTECQSGRIKERQILNRLLRELKMGDTLVIYKLDRLARGTQHMLKMLELFHKKGIHFVSISNHIDTSTPMGKLIFTIMSAFAEMEAELIRERINSGIAAAKSKGIQLGRPLLTAEVNQAIQLYKTSDMAISEIIETCGISKATLYSHLKQHKVPLRRRTISKKRC